MTLLQALLLGIVQGLTEFIPVSSSAHLVLVPWLLSWQLDPQVVFVFDVLVQLGTLLAVFVYFRADLLAIGCALLTGLWQRRPFATPEARLGWWVGLATLPAVVLGLAFKDFFESVFHEALATAGLLLLTAALLVFSERLGRRSRDLSGLNWPDVLVIGLAQALAILPGVSRSGATIAGGLARGLDRPAAARFSFLMSVPVMLGAGAVALNDLLAVSDFGRFAAPILVGFAAAAVVGYLSIGWLLGYLQRRPLYVFAGYCVAASLLCLLVGVWRG